MCWLMAVAITPDWPGTGDQDVFAYEVKGERGVGGVAQGIEDRSDLVADVVGEWEDIRRRQDDEFGERPGPGHPQPPSGCGRSACCQRGSFGSGRR